MTLYAGLSVVAMLKLLSKSGAVHDGTPTRPPEAARFLPRSQKSGGYACSVKLLLLLLPFAFAAVLSPACRDEDFESPSGYDGAVANLDSFDPTTYRDAWQGDVALPDTESPEYPEVTSEQWLELVAKARDEGLMAMDEEDRNLLLQGSIKAYLVLVESTQRRIEVEDEGYADIVEEYSLEDGIHIALAARESVEAGLVTHWGDGAFAEDGNSASKVFVSSFTENATAQEWLLDADGEWTCTTNHDASAGLWFLQAEYYQNLVGTVLLGTPERAETFSGRPAVLFEHSEPGRTRRVWIDEHTLFPIGFALPHEDHEPGVVPARTVLITGLNIDERIVKPDDQCE
jgi:hypothetical protein